MEMVKWNVEIKHIYQLNPNVISSRVIILKRVIFILQTIILFAKSSLCKKTPKLTKLHHLYARNCVYEKHRNLRKKCL